MKQRNINIELLRIISMLMIVYHHFYVHSQFQGLIPLSKKTIVLQSIGNFGKIGVLLFGLISGYFLIYQGFKIKKIFKLSNLVRFYTLISFFVWFIMVGTKELIKENFIYSLFPIVFQRYWFVTAYVILLLFQPILKQYFINETREKQLKNFLIFLFSFSVIEWIGVIFNIRGYFEPSEIFSFILIVIGGNLIRLYQKELHEHLFLFTLCIFFITLILILFKPFLLYNYKELFAFPSYFLTGTGSLNAILFSMSLFSIVTKFNLENFSWITKISSLTFDVYLIHDNKFFRPLIWTVIFSNKEYIDNFWFPLIILFEPFLVFSICLVIAKIRLLIFNYTDDTFKKIVRKKEIDFMS